jgi:hypothetical protein
MSLLERPSFQVSWCDIIFERVTLFTAAVTSFHGPQLPWVQDSLKMFLLRHATVAWWDTFLQAAANFHYNPQSPRVSSFGSPRRPATCFRPLCCFFHPLFGFTVASSSGATGCSTSDSIFSKAGYLHSRHASVVSWQAIVSFYHAPME